jgi:LysR family hydrogen peroxide-inducible transcriptional activator
MELHQLRYLIAVAETGNFTRAAERVNVTQPSLSQQIINLEKELGHKLFHRLGRRAVPTEAGIALLARARRALLELDDAAKELGDSPDLGRHIFIGGIPTVVPYLFPQLIDECRQRFPHLIIHTRENFRGQLVRAVLEGELDLGLVSLPIREPRLSIEPIFTEPLLLVVGKDHPLASVAAVTASDLANQTFILLGESSSVAMQIQRFCGDHDFEPRVGHRCAQIKTVKALVAMGLGISILPKVCRSKDDSAQLVYKRLSGREPEREVAIVRHLQRYQSRGSEQFLGVLRESLLKQL